MVDDERMPEGEEEEQAAEQQAADGDAEVPAVRALTLAHGQRLARSVSYRIAVERKDSNDESAAAAFVTARSRHTNVPATPIPWHSVRSQHRRQRDVGYRHDALRVARWQPSREAKGT